MDINVGSDMERTAPGAWQSQTAVHPPPSSDTPATAPGRGGLTVAGGVAGIIGALLVIVACALPYVRDSQGSPSIFNPGYPGGFWFAIEPIAVILMGIAAGVVILASTQRSLQIATAAILLAIGVQTFFLFLGYAGLNLTTGERSPAPGGVIGVVGGLCLTTGGLLALIRAGWWGRSS